MGKRVTKVINEIITIVKNSKEGSDEICNGDMQ